MVCLDNPFMNDRVSAPLLPQDYSSALDTLLAHSSDLSPRERFAGTDDGFWFWLHTEAALSNQRLAALLPRMPPDSLQRNFTGTAGDQALGLAFQFYQLVHRLVAAYGSGQVESILDFGCGWGRILRFFLRDVAPHRLKGIDCLPEAIELCRLTGLGSHVEQVSPIPPCASEGHSFDLIYAYSVFSHLSETAHLAWLEEFHRLLKPQGLLIVTTRARDFIDYCAYLRTLPDRPIWATAANAFVDAGACLERYDRGEYLYEPVGAGPYLAPSHFGETCIPRGYVERVWSSRYELLEYIADPAVCEQNVIVARRRAGS